MDVPPPPPPPVRPLCARVGLVAGMLAFTAMVVAALTVFGFVAPAFDDYYGYSAREIVGGLLNGAIAVVFGLTAVGLLRRRPMARVVAVMLSIGLAAVAAWMIADVLVLNPSDHGSEVAYVLMGGTQFIAVGIAAAWSLILPSGRTCFEPPPGGWYPDPTGQGRWRVWDGRQWTGYVA